MIMRNCWFFHLENLRHCSVHLWNDCAFCSFKTGSSRCTRRKFKTEALERLKELYWKNIKGGWRR
jgi:hypothetical protein